MSGLTSCKEAGGAAAALCTTPQRLGHRELQIYIGAAKPYGGRCARLAGKFVFSFACLGNMN